VYSKLDLHKAYYQLELAKESRYLTNFSTHVGLRRFKRLNMGTASSSEIFQNAISQVLRGLPGVINMADDILVHGNNQENHDKHLQKVFETLEASGLTLNKEKCVFNKRKIKFMGLMFSAGGVSADKSKIKALKDAEAPSNVSELRSLLGLAQFSAWFIPKFAEITEPLREFTKAETPWSWTERQDKALKELKKALTRETVMAYFSTKRKSELIVDASPKGIAGILCQIDNKGQYTIPWSTSVEL
jgi:hypothetical protein